MTKEDYNSEPVWWCDKCCSLAITTNWLCKKCGNHDPELMSVGTIGEFERAYRKMYIRPHLGWESETPYDDLAEVYSSNARELCTYQEAYDNHLMLTQGKPF